MTKPGGGFVGCRRNDAKQSVRNQNLKQKRLITIMIRVEQTQNEFPFDVLMAFIKINLVLSGLEPCFPCCCLKTETFPIQAKLLCMAGEKGRIYDENLGRFCR